MGGREDSEPKAPFFVVVVTRVSEGDYRRAGNPRRLSPQRRKDQRE